MRIPLAFRLQSEYPLISSILVLDQSTSLNAILLFQPTIFNQQNTSIKIRLLKVRTIKTSKKKKKKKTDVEE